MDSIYIDFSKAFDMVIYVKRWYSSQTLSLVRILYLTHWTQRVQSCGSISYSSESIPRGSNWGPIILFILIINDLPGCLKSIAILLYTDDAKIFQIVNLTLQAQLSLQKDLDQLHAWAIRNGLVINLTKCNILFHFAGKRRTLILSIPSALKLCHKTTLSEIYRGSIRHLAHFQRRDRNSY